MVRSAQDWPWSSFRASAGLTDSPLWLNTDWILSSFAVRRSVAIERYKSFVSEGKNQPALWDKLKNQIYLGNEAFVKRMMTKFPVNADLSEVPLGQRRAMAKPIDHYVKKSSSRDEAIIMAYDSGGYGMKEIGDHFGLHYSRVSRIISGQRKAKDKTSYIDAASEIHCNIGVEQAEPQDIDKTKGV